MLRGVVTYKGQLLAPGSHALKLHAEGRFKDLDAHLKLVEEAKRRLELPC